jgi:hypothetical protein
MQAPQQQRHAAHQVEKNHGSHCSRTPGIESNSKAIGKRRRINPLMFPENGPKQAGFAAGWRRKDAREASAFVNEITKYQLHCELFH